MENSAYSDVKKSLALVKSKAAAKEAPKEKVMQLKMTENRVLVKPESLEGAKSKSGLFMPVDESKAQVRTGVVCSVGPGRLVEAQRKYSDPLDKVKPVRYSMNVVEGDKVLYPASSGLTYRHTDGESYVILTEYEILAVL